MHAVHPVFHVSMLEPSTLNSVLNCIQPPPPLITLDEELEYEISDSKLDKQQVCKLLYLVHWSGKKVLTKKLHGFQPMSLDMHPKLFLISIIDI